MGTPRYIDVIDIGDESLAIYRDEGGGLFAIDASYVEQEIGPTFNPITGEEFDPDEAESLAEGPI